MKKALIVSLVVILLLIALLLLPPVRALLVAATLPAYLDWPAPTRTLGPGDRGEVARQSGYEDIQASIQRWWQ